MSRPILDDHILDLTLLLHEEKLSPDQLQELNRLCSEHLLSIKKIKFSKKQIEVTGRAKDLQAAFGEGTHTRPDFISDVLGLDNSVAAISCLRHQSKTAALIASVPMTPLQLAKLYKFPTGLDGSGQAIAIIELGGGYKQADLNAYFTELKLPGTPNVVSISVDGAQNNPADTSGANYEVVLDIEIAAAIAPKATICVYFAPNTIKGFYDAISAAINDKVYHPSIISISWGSAEKNWSKTSLQSYNVLFQLAASKGITVLAAAGDNLASDGEIGKNVDFPSSSPYVLACGGTEVFFSGDKITSEVVWNERISGTGGGISSVFPLPSYQSGIASLKTKNYRGVPDICGNADPNTGYIIRIDGADTIVGGTSAVAPLWAGLLALINQAKGKPVGFIHSLIYSHPSVCTDITIGNNSGYSATKAWDACTGWGSPNGMALLALLKQ